MKTQFYAGEHPRYRVGVRFEIAPVLPDLGVLALFVRLRRDLWVQARYDSANLRRGRLAAMQQSVAIELANSGIVEPISARALIDDDLLWAPKPVRHHVLSVFSTVHGELFRAAEAGWLVECVEPWTPKSRARAGP